ncbi:hypothetical protein ACIP4V_25135 [Streptomyces albidoflavus]
MAALEELIRDTADPLRPFNAFCILPARNRRALEGGRFRALYHQRPQGSPRTGPATNSPAGA